MKIAGIWSSHDCSFCVLEDGYPIIHAEYERYIRIKEPPGDAAKFLIKVFHEHQDIEYFSTCHQVGQILRHRRSYKKIKKITGGKEIYTVGHHEAHAANAFFSSNFDRSLIITFDGGGYEEDDFSTSCTIWSGVGNKIQPIKIFPRTEINIGSVWARVTSYIFKLHSGYPRGSEAGTVMALAALGDPDRFVNDFYSMLTEDLHLAGTRSPEHKRGVVYSPKQLVHPYLNKWAKLASQDDQTKYDLAAGLQLATEMKMKEIIDYAIAKYPEAKHLCLSGGVTLNSVATGKIPRWYEQFKGVYVTPTPHDGGLTIGSSQYVWHQILGNPRIKWEDNFPPYLGELYNREVITDTLSRYSKHIEYKRCDNAKLIELLADQKIIAIFGGGSESGRRALGNRSILADPRSDKMKDTVNLKVKHRQWFRPFAPSILREEVEHWFERDIDSPYMSFVVNFKKAMKDRVPAVVHFDGSARLHTVTENDNRWYYNLLKLWSSKTGVPILLNTSFNDREPICETPEHAIKCFLKTEIDYLYFYDENILLNKRSSHGIKPKSFPLKRLLNFFR